MNRAAQFTDAGVIVRLHESDSRQTHVLTVQHLSGPNVDDLRRPYANPTTAEQAYTGMCVLFAAGYPVDAVIDFATQVAAQPRDLPELLPPRCELAA